jgi:hypothetical protein|eukprot:5353-Heterococcus_DN1.PRE.1
MHVDTALLLCSERNSYGGGYGGANGGSPGYGYRGAAYDASASAASPGAPGQYPVQGVANGYSMGELVNTLS